MTPETYQKIDGILEEALGRESSAREAFIAKACGADQDLLEHVQALLAAHGQAGAFLSDTYTGGVAYAAHRNGGADDGAGILRV